MGPTPAQETAALRAQHLLIRGLSFSNNSNHLLCSLALEVVSSFQHLLCNTIIFTLSYFQSSQRPIIGHILTYNKDYVIYHSYYQTLLFRILNVEGAEKYPSSADPMAYPKQFCF